MWIITTLTALLGGVLGGWLARRPAEAIARTGVLSGAAIRRARMDEL